MRSRVRSFPRAVCRARAGVVGAAAGRAGALVAQAADERFHIRDVGAELRVGGADEGGEAAHQNSDRRSDSPAASIVAIRAFTASTFSPMTSSSSLGFPSKRIGSPK